MIKHLLTTVYLSLISSCYSQSIRINGRIIDYGTDLTLAYATIEFFSLHTGTIADENGKFILETAVCDPQIDTIEFSYLGYGTERICVADFLVSDKTIKLKRLPITLEGVEISPKKYKTEIVGVRVKQPTGFQVAKILCPVTVIMEIRRLNNPLKPSAIRVTPFKKGKARTRPHRPGPTLPFYVYLAKTTYSL